MAAALRGFAEDVSKPIEIPKPEPQALPKDLDGPRTTIAHDRAFAFLYRANLDLLRALGTELVFFSPLDEYALLEVDALYLPGGYPEPYLDRLAGNRSIQAAIRAHHAAGMPIPAECGEMLYLLESLPDTRGRTAHMVGLLPSRATRS